MHPTHVYPKAKALSHPHSLLGPWTPVFANKFSPSIGHLLHLRTLSCHLRKRNCTSRHLPHPLHLPGILLWPLCNSSRVESPSPDFFLISHSPLRPLQSDFAPWPCPPVTSSVDYRKTYIKNSADAKNLFFRSMPLFEFVKLLLAIKEGLLPLRCPQHLFHAARIQVLNWPLFCHLFIWLWDKDQGWPHVHSSPVSALQVLGIQACTTYLTNFIAENNPPNFSSKTHLNLETFFLYCKPIVNPSSGLCPVMTSLPRLFSFISPRKL